MSDFRFGRRPWGATFEDNTAAVVSLDRLLHHATVLQIDGDSYRMRGHRARLQRLRNAIGPSRPATGYGPWMSVEATIRGHGLRFMLRVDAYERPAAQTGTDANWLTGVIELELGRTGRFQARKQLTPFAPELVAFRDQLRTLDRDLTGRATLTHLEDEFELTITLQNGKGIISGYVREHIGASLGFDQIETDQTQVREALEQFEAIADAFPARGNLTDT